MKVYVHNFFTEELFIILAHNSTNRVYNVYKSHNKNQKIGSVFCDYKGTSFDFVFNPELNDNTDGIHLIDFFSIVKNHYIYKDFNNLEFKFSDDGKNPDYNNYNKIINRIIELIHKKKDWIVIYFRTEKILSKVDVPKLELNTEVFEKFLLNTSGSDEFLYKLKNHKIVSDNVFLNDITESHYPNFFYTFTNSFYNWNDLLQIRWYYEFKDLFQNLNKPYNIGFSIRKIRKNRKKILELLKKQNNEKIFLSFTDYYEKNIVDKNVDTFLNDGINYNSTKGKNDFENIENIKNITIGLDLFFRILSKSKVQILDETWASLPVTYTHQYLSEKTLGYVLAEIPFISTHTYPLDILEKVLGLDKHPFYNETKNSECNPETFCNFVKLFLENFNENYLLCLEWSKQANEKLLQTILSKNDLLDLLNSNFKKNTISIPNKKLL